MRHLTTMTLFAASIALYLAGQVQGSVLLFMVGGACELVGWKRVLARRKS